MVFNLTYDDDVTIPQINEDNNNVYIGLSYIILSCSFMFLQTMTFVAFYRNREILMKNMPYKIMLQLGIADLIQQLCHCISGFYAVFYFFPSDVLSYAVGSLLQCAYMTSASFILLLSLNRFDVFYNISIIPTFDKKRAFVIGIIICYIWGISLFIFYLFPSNRLEFSSINYGWNYTGNKTLGYQIENKSVIAMLIISFICYLFILGKIMYMRGLSSSGIIITLSDMKLLVQAIINFITITLLEICWYQFSGIITDAELNLLAINYLFIFVSGANTLLNFCFLKEVRKEVKTFLICYTNRKQKITRTVVRRIAFGDRDKNLSTKTKILTE
uniref:G_PROTEIN_RECEP_F1_2 domain-containing protein n=1 Tax=Strongyloides venezuelensis TaxID=75913 RepID=A0A0K0FIB0_STRVS